MFTQVYKTSARRSPFTFIFFVSIFMSFALLFGTSYDPCPYTDHFSVSFITITNYLENDKTNFYVFDFFTDNMIQ